MPILLCGDSVALASCTAKVRPVVAVILILSIGAQWSQQLDFLSMDLINHQPQETLVPPSLDPGHWQNNNIPRGWAGYTLEIWCWWHLGSLIHFLFQAKWNQENPEPEVIEDVIQIKAQNDPKTADNIISEAKEGTMRQKLKCTITEKNRKNADWNCLKRI